MNILVVVAHLDDETFGMFGTLEKYKNNNIKVVSICKGRRNQNYEDRKLNFIENMNLIGVKYKIFDYFDLELYKESQAIVSDIIRNEIITHKTDILFCTAPDLHQEHKIINQCTKVAVRNTQVKKFYEIFIPGSSDISYFKSPFLVDINITNKLEACKNYKSEIKDNINIIKDSAIYIGTKYNMKTAEMFNVVFDKGSL